MKTPTPALLAKRTHRAYERWRAEGLGLVREKYLQSKLPERWDAASTAAGYFAGKIGVEVGGPSGVFGDGGPLPAYGLAERVDNCNFCGETAWVHDQKEGSTFVFHQGKPPGKQYFCEASALTPLADGSYDFVLSSHCIEHLANPIAALREWQRVLRPGGALLLVAPHKDTTFDHRRPVTTLSHLIQDFERHMDESDVTHVDEVLRLHDLKKDAGSGDFGSFKARTEANLVHRCVHHHVFNTHLTAELADYSGLQILNVQLLRPCHIVVLAQKLADPDKRDNTPFVAKGAAPVWTSPLPSDQRNYW